MLKNFFISTIRNIRKNRTYAVINFTGLTCGFTLALLILTYVRQELRFEAFHKRSGDVYRLTYHVHNGMHLASTPPPIAPLMKDYFPGVEAAARMFGRNVSITRPDSDTSFEETQVFFADSSITRIFSFDELEGSVSRALREPFSIVITDQIATKYFGDKSPLGELLVFGGRHHFKVAAVVKEFPYESHLHFNVLAPYENMYDMESELAAEQIRENLSANFIISHSYTYVLLRPGSDPNVINKNMDAFLQQFAKPELLLGQTFELMPLTDIRLRSELMDEPQPANTLTNIYIFLGVGLLTLLIACINYINLATAQSFARTKEIGIRKIMGSMNRQLIGQFLAESFIFCLIAMILSFGMFHLTLPYLNDLTGSQLQFSDVLDNTTFLASLLLLLAVTLLAGGYPAFFVTRFNSIQSIKGTGTVSLEGGNFLRRVLVIFQLVIACLLLSASLMIFKQLRYLNSRPLGFQKEHIITVPLFSQNLNTIFAGSNEEFQSKLKAFRDDLEQNTAIFSTTLSSNVPGLGIIFRGVIPEGFRQEDHLVAANLAVDYDFFHTYDVGLVSGRLFSRDYEADEEEGFIINETAVLEFFWNSPEEALGKKMNREGKNGTVIGVVKDFNFTSLTMPVSALIMELVPDQYSILSVKLANDRVPETLDLLETKWRATFPEKAFEFSFLNEQLHQQYETYQNFGRVIRYFTFISALIACLGVYGLILFVAQRKVNEIGVRKVLGASVWEILQLLYKEFAFLIIVAFLMAVPISYYLINRWFENNFVYHTDIDALTYLFCLIIVLFIVTATVSFKAIKASLTNPVAALRSE